MPCAMRHASRYSIGGTPTARLKRSKNAERDRADSLASCSTVQDLEGLSCIWRIAAARRVSARPRKSPGDAAAPAEFAKVSVTTRPVDVAEAVWRAANDTSDQLHLAAGPDAVALANAKQ